MASAVGWREAGIRPSPGTRLDAKLSTSFYEHAGGKQAPQRLEESFYTKVLADPVLKTLFTERRPDHVDRLTWFTAESFGGPDRFGSELDLQHVIDAHRRLKITDERRERFIA